MHMCGCVYVYVCVYTQLQHVKQLCEQLESKLTSMYL